MFAPSVYRICTHIFPQDEAVFKADHEAMKKGNVVVNCSLMEAVTVLDKQQTDFSLFCNLTDLLLSYRMTLWVLLLLTRFPSR